MSIRSRSPPANAFSTLAGARACPLEFLVGVQDALRGERKFNAWSDLTRVARRLAKMRRGSVLDVGESPIRTTMARLLLMRVQWAVERALLDPEQELARDVWRLGLLRRDGGRQRLDLTVISQPWLREIYRDWAREALATPSRRLPARHVVPVQASERIAAHPTRRWDGPRSSGDATSRTS